MPLPIEKPGFLGITLFSIIDKKSKTGLKHLRINGHSSADDCLAAVPSGRNLGPVSQHSFGEVGIGAGNLSADLGTQDFQ